MSEQLIIGSFVIFSVSICGLQEQFYMVQLQL